MNEVDFIIKKLNNIIDQVPTIKVRYEVDNLNNTHIIEILPKSEYNNNQKLITLKDELAGEFIDNYYELLSFITEGSVFKVNNPIFEKEGINYVYSWGKTSNNTPSPLIIHEQEECFHNENNYALAA